MSDTLQYFDKFLTRLAERIPNALEGGMTCFRLLRVVTPRFRVFLEQTLSNFGLNETQYFALMAIYVAENGEILPSTLSCHLDLTRTSVTRLSDDLLSRGWITRKVDKNNRRQVVLRLTKQGEELINQVSPILLEKRIKFCEAFTPEEIQLLENILRRLIIELDKQILESDK